MIILCHPDSEHKIQCSPENADKYAASGWVLEHPDKSSDARKD
jgi:hypothetical protein